jgi:hypothetical protein
MQAPLDEKFDHARGTPAGHLIIEYGDYQRPYFAAGVAAGRIPRDVDSGLASGRVRARCR